MSLTASPFDANTGELLPVYRDAYLRGDLSREHTAQVDAYLAKNKSLGNETWQRFHSMQQTGEQVRPVGWMQRQMDLVRTSPQRTRRQAASLVAMAALVGGAVFAGTGTGTGTMPASSATVIDAPLETASTLRMTTVRGKILDENGRPLVGATVLDKASRRGVSTNANGEYIMLVPADRPTTLAYGYGGYGDDEIQVKGARVENVTLVPTYQAPAKPTRQAKGWFSFLR